MSIKVWPDAAVGGNNYRGKGEARYCGGAGRVKIRGAVAALTNNEFAALLAEALRLARSVSSVIELNVQVLS